MRAAVRRGAARQQLVEHRHPDDDAGGDLLADHGLRRVDHLGGELDPAVDRARVHEHLAGAEPAAVDLVLRGVLADARHERVGHALLLHPQRVDDVGLLELVERVGDVAAERLDVARDQRRRAADVTLAPIFWKAWMFERATRQWVTSPTIQMLRPSSAPSRSRSV